VRDPRAIMGNIIVDEEVVGIWQATPMADEWDEQGYVTLSCQYAEVGYLSDAFEMPTHNEWSYGHIAGRILQGGAQ
jgi:hypothetical protein